MKVSARPVVRSLPPGSLVFLACAWCAPLFAQVPAAADRAWDNLKNFGRPPPAAPATGATSPKPTRAEQAAASIDQANQLRAFYTQYPGHASAKDAKRLEALALNYGALAGDASQEERRTRVIGEVRADPAIPAANRFEVVAWSQQVAMGRQTLPTRASRLAVHEEVARGLMAEFPAVADGFESLLAVARHSAPERAGTVARQLLLAPATPTPTKTEAQRLLDQLSLIGKSLDEILTRADAVGLRATAKKAPTIVYTWSAEVAASQQTAKRLAQRFPAAEFIGVCLDNDTTRARQMADTSGLPGRQYFDARGTASPLAAALVMNQPSLTYLADSSGVIRDVQGNQDTKAKLNSFAP